ncbi:MAG: DUF6356 family protein [Sphingomonas sp.]|jgi:hypothetical protein|uniref:DUF6356 family protein n=1 Tax=unclassified Sphingomonas TaxID=196159 RepID=UPI00053DBB44|nr:MULTISPECIES: DUF6356 family protein [unclassified Sphingomonas]MDR6848628.1 uncharacterized membrane protein YgaE (UPF0421/DUF939 family) [Sphingomonas sp. BE137]MDR7255910.1 uncharacterized membrane protein YgaE (UPF0421/DUF939 family) [Sphingomonas sp. BE270]RUN76179.1 hypothetical protein EJC47_12405 [Sphingomonas sp. TF3]
MFRRLFLDHPASVGESYAEHFGVASRFGVTLIGGGLACLVHAVVPAAFKTTGSQTVLRLNKRIVEKRAAVMADELQRRTVEYVI